jgi:hypothetical protein
LENLQQKESEFAKKQIQMQQEIEALKEALNSCCETNLINDFNNIEQNQSINNSEKIILYQNAPNPFHETTTIQCYLPQSIQKAELCVYNMQGVQVKCVTVSERGNVNIQIQAGQLTASVYTYLLIGDKKTSDNMNNQDSMLIARKPVEWKQDSFDKTNYICEPADLEKMATGLISIKSQDWYKKYKIKQYLKMQFCYPITYIKLRINERLAKVKNRNFENIS